jgi:hypothetical protein
MSLQVRVKMVTSDDEAVTDIVVEGDKEELERMSKASICSAAVPPLAIVAVQVALQAHNLVGYTPFHPIDLFDCFPLDQ